MPGFGVVGGHAHALLGSGVEFVEKMSIDSDAGGDDEITRAGIALEIGKFTRPSAMRRGVACREALAAAATLRGRRMSCASALAVPMGRMASAMGELART